MEDEPDATVSKFRLLLIRQCKQILPLEKNGAAARAVERAKDVQQGAFAGPRCANDGQHFAARDSEIDPLEDRQLKAFHLE